MKWSTYEKEAYAIYFSLMKWEHHLRDVHFTLQTDHKNLTYLNTDLKQKVQRWKLAIQEYDFDIEHIPGKDNIVADGLSRYCEFPTEFQENLMQTNAFIMETIDYHKQDICEQSNLLIDTFLLLPEEKYDILEETDNKIPNRIFDTITLVHNSGIGHSGVESTLRRLNILLETRPELNIPEMQSKRQYVTSFIRKCPLCQKMALLKIPIHTRPFTISTYNLWDRIAIDSIGPLPESTEGHKHILVFIDSFSRFIELIPIANLTAELAANSLIQIIGRYGIPQAILTDNGTQFANNIFDELPKILEFSHQKIQAYSHEENSIVERANKEIMRHLRDITFDTRIHADWYKYLPYVQRIKNSEIHSSIGVSPATLVFGPNIDLNRGILTEYKVPPSNISKYIADNIHYQNLAIKVAQESQFNNVTKRIENQLFKKRKHSETEFPINSYVLVQYEHRDGLKSHSPPSKLHPKLRGPFRIISKTTRNNQGSIYTCENLVTNKLEDFHVTNLQPFQFDEEKVNPLEIALTDNESFQVENVIKHRFTDSQKKIKSNLQFLIQWKGIKQPSWEPWKNISKLQLVQEYLKNHRQLKKFAKT